MNRYLITGAAGFIGSHLAYAVADQPNTDVVAVDNLSTGNIQNLDNIIDKITFIQGDITDSQLLKSIMTGVDYVLHQAALPSVPRSIADPLDSNWNNVNGTLNMLIAARDAGVKRFVFASSSSVYGMNPELPKIETQQTHPKSPYALTKLTGEHYCRIFFELYGLETVALRYFNVFGPRQNPFSQYSAVIPLFISHLVTGQKSTIFGDGNQSRDFTYVTNVVQANLNACTVEGIGGSVFNIGCGAQTTVNHLYTMIQKILGTNLNPDYALDRPGDVKHSLADISQAQLKLGYSPQISVWDGLIETVDYYVKTLGKTN